MERDGTWMCLDVVGGGVYFSNIWGYDASCRNYFLLICLKMIFLLIVFRIHECPRLIIEFGP